MSKYLKFWIIRRNSRIGFKVNKVSWIPSSNFRNPRLTFLKGSLSTEFVKSPHSYQISTIRSLLTTLTSPQSTSQSRSSSARHLLHIAHGTFSSTTSTSPEHHLHLVLGNCRLLREAGALKTLWEAIKRATEEWEVNSGVPSYGQGNGQQEDEDGEEGHYQHNQHQPILTEEEEEKERMRQEKLDEINAELASLLAVVYFMVECFRGEDQWGQELSKLIQFPIVP